MDCSLNGATGANSTLLMLIAAVVLCAGAVAVVMSRRKAPALAAVALAFVAVGVGGAAGRADAAAGDCAGFPMCIDNQDPAEPDSLDALLTSTDGVHITLTGFSSTDGTCTGNPSAGGSGAVADSEAEALALCGTSTVINLNELVISLGYFTPTPPANWWGCVGAVITPGP